MHLLPMGDQAVMAYLDSETEALAYARAIGRAEVPWVIDIVPAYTSVAVFFDLKRINYQAASRFLDSLFSLAPEEHGSLSPAAGERGRGEGAQPRLHRIPCCYEMGLDLERIAAHAGLTVPEVIRLHTASTYTVYAIGFCPGFPYLGYLPAELSGVPRLPAPRLRVEAGSVGLAGRQTGIYPEPRPGGWNILGRTPLELVNVAEGYFPLRAGDQVQFVRIDGKQFRDRLGERLV